MYNIYITSAYHDEIDLGTDEHLADAIARAQRTITDWKLQNGEIIEIVGPAQTGGLEVKWTNNAGEPYPSYAILSVDNMGRKTTYAMASTYTYALYKAAAIANEDTTAVVAYIHPDRYEPMVKITGARNTAPMRHEAPSLD